MADLPRNYDQFARDIFADCRHICKDDSPKSFMNDLIKKTRVEIAAKVAGDPELATLDKKLEAIQSKIADIKEADLQKLKILFREEYETLWKDLSPRLQKPGLIYNYDNLKEVITGSEFYRVVKEASDNKILDIKPIDMMIDLVVTKNLAKMRATPPVEQVVAAKTDADLSDAIKAQINRVFEEARQGTTSPRDPNKILIAAKATEEELELAKIG